MNLQLEKKLAFVTGSTAGIGFAIAKALAAEGARVIVNGRTEARVAAAIASIRADIPSAKLEALAMDLSKADDATEATKRYPDVDVLVNNLGIYQLKPFEQITDAEWSAIIETLATLCHNGRSRGPGCVRGQSAFFRDQRGGVACGRRCRAFDSLKRRNTMNTRFGPAGRSTDHNETIGRKI